jgi:competence protein ComEA
MKSIWWWLKDYFDLSFGERRGISVLLVLIFLVISIRYIAPYFIAEQEYDFTEIKQLGQELEEKQKTGVDDPGFTANNFSFDELEGEALASAQLFAFDPNIASAEDLKRLGFSPKLAKTIINYRNKGGKFRKKEDLQKIYGLKESQYLRLEPYISLPGTGNKTSGFNKYEEKNAGFERKVRAELNLEINTADSAELVKLNGIGPAFASRIIKYRKLLGGFVQKEQLKEVYGLDSLKFQQIGDHINVDPGKITKLNINMASAEELRKHPYFKYKLANAIVQYRQRHGNFKNVEELKKIYLLDQKTYEKILPYIVVE